MYYVYVYLDTRKKGDYIYGDFKFNYEPIYIGKGCRGRDKSHYNNLISNKKFKNPYFENKLKKIHSNGFEIKFKRIKDNLSERDALDLEIKLIKLIGRKGIGSLCNLTDGGDRGLNKSKETLDKLSKSKRGNKNPMFGKEHSKDHKEKISKGLIKFYEKNENPYKGLNWDEKFGLEKSVEIKEKLKNRVPPMEGKKHSKESKLKMSLAKLGDKNPNKNGLSEEHKEKIRLGNLGKKMSLDSIEKGRLKKIGKQVPKRRVTYTVISPKGNIFKIIMYKNLIKFIKNNNLSQKCIIKKINKGVITEKDFQFLTSVGKNTLGWEFKKERNGEI